MLHPLELSLQPSALGDGFEVKLQEWDWRGERDGRKENGEMQKGVGSQTVGGSNRERESKLQM